MPVLFALGDVPSQKRDAYRIGQKSPGVVSALTTPDSPLAAQRRLQHRLNDADRTTRHFLIRFAATMRVNMPFS